MRRPRLLPTLFLVALTVGVGGALWAPVGAQVNLPTDPTTTAAPPTTAATTAPPATEAPATTAAPATTVAPTTTRKAATTIPPTTTTPDQLPTLPPIQNAGQPAVETTVRALPSGDAARIDPLFPAISIAGFTIALLILVLQFLVNTRRSTP